LATEKAAQRASEVWRATKCHFDSPSSKFDSLIGSS
jgi:hypothetical protein